MITSFEAGARFITDLIFLLVGIYFTLAYVYQVIPG